MSKTIEIDLWYLSEQRIEMLPVRRKMTIRFVDSSGVLTRMRTKLDMLQSEKRKMYIFPLPTGINRFFETWRRSRHIERVMRLETKLEQKVEAQLRHELLIPYSSLRPMLIRNGSDETEFYIADVTKRNYILEILNDNHRFFKNDWIEFSDIRIIDPTRKEALAAA